MNANRRCINQLVAGEVVDQVFMVCEKDLRTTRNGDLFLTYTLADRTGRLDARMWNVNETLFQAIPVDGFVHIRGRTEDYRGRLQLILEGCRPCPRDKVDLSEFLATTACDIDAMFSELLEILRGIQDPHIRLLIKRFLEDKDLMAAFKRSPAALQLHHAYIGGLLEHTLNIARAAKAILPLYPKVNADLVLAGVFLHDIGKTAELSATTSVQYTDRGQLVGHLTLAAIWIEQRASEVAREMGAPFPPRTLDLLQHIVLSHHGSHEFGSPKLPMIPESFLLHYLDNLDAKMWMCQAQIEQAPQGDSNFTGWLPQLSTRLYRRSGDLTESPPPPPTAGR